MSHNLIWNGCQLYVKVCIIHWDSPRRTFTIRFLGYDPESVSWSFSGSKFVRIKFNPKLVKIMQTFTIAFKFVVWNKTENKYNNLSLIFSNIFMKMLSINHLWIHSDNMSSSSSALSPQYHFLSQSCYHLFPHQRSETLLPHHFLHKLVPQDHSQCSNSQPGHRWNLLITQLLVPKYLMAVLDFTFCPSL